MGAAVAGALALAGCGSATTGTATTSAVRAPAVTTDPQNLYDCLAQAHARVSIDPDATPRRYVAAAAASRAAHDGSAGMAARFRDGTRADYEVWGTAAEAAHQRGRVDGGSAEARGNVVVVYPVHGARGRAGAATTACVPR